MATADDESPARVYRALEDRLQSLEESHVRLREELDKLVHQNGKEESAGVKSDSIRVSSEYSFPGCIEGYFSLGSPYKSVLESLGHAVHVCSAATGEIIYWYVCARRINSQNCIVLLAYLCYISDSLVAQVCFFEVILSVIDGIALW